MADNTPPVLRTHLGLQFNEANRDCALALQHCAACGCVQYPPREVCQECLGGELAWRETDTRGAIISQVALHHSISDFFNGKIGDAPWPVASVKLDCGTIVFAHLALHTFVSCGADAVAPGTAVQVFSHEDCSNNAVLVAAAADAAIETGEQRRTIVEKLGLLG